jgi:CrcB protein
MTTALVGIAGTLGVLARYGISRLTLHSDALVWSTVGINIAGSFLLGLLVAEHWFDRDVREALGVGFLGGFTTFSTFSVQIVLEVDAGEPGRAAWVPARHGGGRCRGSDGGLRAGPEAGLAGSVSDVTHDPWHRRSLEGDDGFACHPPRAQGSPAGRRRQRSDRRPVRHGA